MPKNNKKRDGKKALLVLILLVGLTALAGVFVFNPGLITVTQQEAVVIFTLGTNANQPDLEGNTIGVILGANQTSAQVTLHPTYQRNLYTDILHIRNNGTADYYVYIRVTTPMTLPTGGSAQMIVHNGTTTYTVDLTTTTTVSLGKMTAGAEYPIDIEIYIPEGGQPITTSVEFSVIFSPEATTPP